MTTEKWFACVNPKVRGAWNLHHTLNGHDQSLDFFLMKSSIAGSVGNPTESNYCAANSFLDAFARYRRSLGLPAPSIGLGAISEVGYLHEHPEIEETMLRRGVQPYTEDEMLCIIDIALSQEDRQAPHFTDAHVLTGFETQAMQKIIQRGFSVQNGVLNDPIAGLIARALEALQSRPLSGDASEKPHDGLSIRKEELNEMLDAGHPERAQQIAVEMAAELCGNLLLLPAEKLLKAGRLADFGMDSMLAAEFRASMFKAFGVDVPFTVLTDEQCQLQDVASVIVKDLLRQRSN